MATGDIEARVIQKVATEAEWQASTILPRKGEFMIVGDSNSAPINIKVGNGVDMYPALPYMFDSIQQNVNYVAITGTALPTPEADVAFSIVGEGSYTFGGNPAFTVPEGHWGVSNWSSGAWSLVDMGELPHIPADAGLNLDDKNPTSGNTVAENDKLTKSTIGIINGIVFEIGGYEGVSGNTSGIGAINKDGTVTSTSVSNYRRTSVTSNSMFIANDTNSRYYYTGEIRNDEYAGVIFQDIDHNFLGYDCSAFGTYVDRELVLPEGTHYIGSCSLDVPPIIRKRSFVNKISNIDSLNGNLPFIKNATFISDNPTSIGQDRSWVKVAVKGLKLYGIDVNKKYSPYVITRNDSGLWRIEIWEDTGTGNGVDKTRILRWERAGYAEPSGIDTIIHYEGYVGFKIYIDWSNVPVGANGGITYNAGGLDLDALINFSTSSDTPQSDEYELSWQYNNVDAPVTGTDLFKMFTLIPNVDEDDDTLGCTGASYNKDTEEFVISYYSFAKAAKLWFFKRKDLVDYSPLGTIAPKPTREIDLSQYLYHIQGNVYDPETKTYWVIGSLNPVSNDDERVLIRVDDEGNQLERYVMSNYSFQAGMIALSPDLKNLLIKPNNRNWLLEIDKVTKEQIRQVTVATNNEGLGVDYDNGFVWIGGDSGNLFKYQYSNMTLLQTIPYQSLPSGSSQNIEGLIVDIDGALLNIADAYLHGGNNNGNCMFVYDFNKTIGKNLYFPEMYKLNILNQSPIIDFNGFSSIQEVIITNGSGDIEYRGSDTAPTYPVVNRENWRDLPYYSNWGSTTPSAWDKELPNTRYIQFRVI